MDLEVVRKGLEPSSVETERIRAIVEAGISMAVISDALAVPTSSLRNWRYGQARPRTEQARNLDDIRYSLQVLISRGLEPDKAAQWMQSREGRPPFARPLELIRENPLEVFAMIDRFIPAQ